MRGKGTWAGVRATPVVVSLSLNCLTALWVIHDPHMIHDPQGSEVFGAAS